MRWRALVPMPSYRPISDAAPGATFGNHRANFPRHVRTSPGMVFAAQLHELIAIAGARSFPISPYKRGVTSSNPVAPTKFLQLGGLFETLIGGWVNHSREPPVHAPGRGRVPKGHASVGQLPQEAARPRGCHPDPAAGRQVPVDAHMAVAMEVETSLTD